MDEWIALYARGSGLMRTTPVDDFDRTHGRDSLGSNSGLNQHSTVYSYSHLMGGTGAMVVDGPIKYCSPHSQIYILQDRSVQSGTVSCTTEYFYDLHCYWGLFIILCDIPPHNLQFVFVEIILLVENHYFSVMGHSCTICPGKRSARKTNCTE